MAARKDRGRRAYLSDFHMDVSGRYVYTGAVYGYDGPLPARQFTVRVAALSAAMTAAAVAAGCMPTPAMLNSFYVILPFVGEMSGVLFSAWAAARLLRHGLRLRSYVYRATVESLPVKLTVAACFALLCAAAQVVFLAIHGLQDAPFFSLIPFACKALVAAAALRLRRLIRASCWSAGELSADGTRE